LRRNIVTEGTFSKSLWENSLHKLGMPLGVLDAFARVEKARFRNGIEANLFNYTNIWSLL